MLLGGYQKLTLIDFPGKLAATVFTVGCNFRCPFCHNPELVLSTSLARGIPGARLLEKKFFKFLETRKGKLEGVCITGGEPTIQPDLFDFIGRIKKMNFAVKLDTNGSRPDVLKKLLDAGLLDFVAMDIKNRPEKYARTVGAEVDLERIKLSAEMLKRGRIPYEFRTTAVPGIHTLSDFQAIAFWLSGAKAYSLQKYREERILDPDLKKKTGNKEIDLGEIKKKIENNFGKVMIK